MRWMLCAWTLSRHQLNTLNHSRRFSVTIWHHLFFSSLLSSLYTFWFGALVALFAVCQTIICVVIWNDMRLSYKTIAKLSHITTKTCKCKLNYRPRSNRLSIEATHTHTPLDLGGFFSLYCMQTHFYRLKFKQLTFLSTSESKLLFTNLMNRYNDCVNKSKPQSNWKKKQQQHQQ